MSDLNELNKQLMEQNAELLKQVALLTQQTQLLTEQVQLLTHKLFGRSSEKSTPNAENQINLFSEEDLQVFNEAEVLSSQTAVEPQMTDKIRPVRRKSGHKSQLIKDLPVQIVECVLHEDDCHCEWCNTQLRSIGQEYVREEVEFIPAKLKVKKFYRTAYECPTCKKDGADAIVKSDTPQPVISKSLASASSVAWLLHQKFEMSLPFQRQEKEWENYGITLSRATMANWVIQASKQWLNPLYQLLHHELKESNCLFADETPMKVLREPGRPATSKSYMWLYRNEANADHPIVLYEYKPTRSGDHPKEFLRGFHGYLHCDGYDGYNKVENVTRIGCWAHVRRKFHEGIPKQTAPGTSLCAVGQDYCDQLFRIEREIANLDYEERRKARKKLSRPVLDSFWTWAEGTHALPNSALGKALQYAQNEKPYLMNYLLHGECQLSNNLAERSIRPFVVGRKAWYFSTSPKGAVASSIAYSIIETAKANGLDAYRYLKYLFDELPSVPFKEHPELLQEYLPWAPDVVKNCK